MDCLDCQNLLSEYIDGDLKPNKRPFVIEHLKTCKDCSLVYQDLKQIVNLSQQLPLLEPPNHIWKKLEKEISKISKPQARSSWASFLDLRWQFSISAPQLAGALAFLILFGILGSFFSYVPQNSSLSSTIQSTIIARPVSAYVANPTEMELNGKIERLSHNAKELYQDWDPEMQKLFDRNIVLVDETIDDCRQLSQKNPNDPVVHELMVTAYQEKVRLLEQFLSLK